MLRSRFAVGALALLGVLTACADSPTAAPAVAVPAFAKGAGGGGGVPVPVCATVTVTNNGQTVRNLSMPDIKYNLASCGTTAINVTVTVSEWASAWSVLCPSPVAAPVRFALGPNQKLSATFPVYRGPCGFTSNVNGVLVQGYHRWQGHNLMLSVTNDADGSLLSTSSFSWQDAIPNGP